MSDTKIKGIIRALLAKAQSTDSEAERDAFLAKAAELMQKHQIEEFELGGDDEIGITYGIFAQQGPPAYKSQVQCALAKFYGCDPIRVFSDAKHWQVHLVGLESARATTELMTDFVWKQVCRQAKDLRAERHMKIDVATRHVAKALVLRLGILTTERKRKASDAPPGTSFSLAVVNQVDAFKKARYPDLFSIKARPKSIHTRAMELAKNIPVEEQIGKDKPLQLV